VIRELLRGSRPAEGEPAGRTTSGHLRSVKDGDPAGPTPLWVTPPGTFSVAAAYEHCEAFARRHHESFPVASRFVPAELRKHLIALYAFARAADDFADEPAYEGRRSEALDAWQAELDRCFHGEARHPLFIALGDTIEKRELPLPPFDDLLSAFRTDLEITRYASFSGLRAYTARSAEPVGRLLLPLFGYRDPALVRFADEISTALQLTNFWQDVAADAARGHMYIPAEDLHFFGVTEADVKALRPTTALRDLIRFEVARTRTLFQHGRPLLRLVGHDLRLELTLIWLLGMAILDKIEAADFDVFSQRPAIRRRDQAKVLAKAARSWALDFEVRSLRKFWP
jgi:squalene synthase HpnC